jgi:hypothetical protein
MCTIHDILFEHSTNPAYDIQLTTNSPKAWAKDFYPIQNIIVHMYEKDGVVTREFDQAFLLLLDDDKARLKQVGFRSNALHG